MLVITLAFITLLIAATTKAAASSKAELASRQHRQQARLHADRGALRFCHNHPKAHAFCTPARLRFVRARIGWTSRELAETVALLNPWRVPGWFVREAECIYSHESGGYGWHAHTGNGYETGMQFLRSTWERAGGHVDRDGHFYQASAAEIIYRAWVIVRMNHGSWREWSTRGYCGLA